MWGTCFGRGGTALTTLRLLSAGAAREALVAPHRAWQLRAQGHLSRLVESARLYEGRLSEAEALLGEALGFQPQAAPLLALQARLAKQD